MRELNPSFIDTYTRETLCSYYNYYYDYYCYNYSNNIINNKINNINNNNNNNTNIKSITNSNINNNINKSKCFKYFNYKIKIFFVIPFCLLVIHISYI